MQTVAEDAQGKGQRRCICISHKDTDAKCYILLSKRHLWTLMLWLRVSLQGCCAGGLLPSMVM